MSLLATAPLWVIGGIVTELVGVTALGYDVVRIQRLMRRSAQAHLSAYDILETRYGDIPDSLNDVQKAAARWRPTVRPAAETVAKEALESARQSKEDVAAVASVSADISEYVTALAVTLAERAKEESRVADVSLRISIAGVVLIAWGLSAQVFGIALAELIPASE